MNEETPRDGTERGGRINDETPRGGAERDGRMNEETPRGGADRDGRIYDETPNDWPALRFRRDGTFTILQLTDVHWRNGEAKDRLSLDLMNRVFEWERPDLAIFTGDLI